MKIILTMLSFIFLSCAINNENQKKMKLNQENILKILDESIDEEYFDFINFDDGYSHVVSSKLHLFKDDNDWAIVFEKTVVNYRSYSHVVTEISYFGNCLKDLPIVNDRLCNRLFIDVENDIYETYNKKDTANFNGNSILLIDKKMLYNYTSDEYEDYILGVLRYYSDKSPFIFNSTDETLRKCLPKNLKEILVLDSWYHLQYSKMNPVNLPSQQKTYQMLAKVLSTGDITLYVPNNKPNTNWKFFLDTDKY